MTAQLEGNTVLMSHHQILNFTMVINSIIVKFIKFNSHTSSYAVMMLQMFCVEMFKMFCVEMFSVIKS